MVFTQCRAHPVLAEILATARAPWRALARLPVRKSWPMLMAALKTGEFRAEDLPWGALGYQVLNRHLDRF